MQGLEGWYAHRTKPGNSWFRIYMMLLDRSSMRAVCADDVSPSDLGRSG